MKDLRNILKNCPSGMELDCTLCENVFFDKVIEDAIYPIILYHDNNGCRYPLCLTEDGKFNFRPGYKCVIFPKGKTTWEGFIPPYQFKDGDIVYLDFGHYYKIVIFKRQYNDFLYYHALIKDDNVLSINTNYSNICTSYLKEIRYATKEEKERLFKAIENNNYKWNDDTKTLQKIIKHNFKNGDVLETGVGNLILFSHTQRQCDKDVVFFHCILTPLDELKIRKDSGVGGVDNCFLASDKQRERLFNKLNKAGYKWDAIKGTLESCSKFEEGNRIKHIVSYKIGTIVKVHDNGYSINCGDNKISFISKSLAEKDYELIHDKFNMDTLIPFESSVLIRNDKTQRWMPAFWGYKVEGGFITTFGWSKYCIPYKGNEYLLKSTNDCDDYYNI